MKKAMLPRRRGLAHFSARLTMSSLPAQRPKNVPVPFGQGGQPHFRGEDGDLRETRFARRENRDSPRGFSLVEMIVVITVGTALTGLAVTTLGSLMHASRAMDDHGYRIATIRRLADQFRDDVHAAAKSQSLSVKELAERESKERGRMESGVARKVVPGKGTAGKNAPRTAAAVKPVAERGRAAKVPATGQRFELAPNHAVIYTMRPGIVDRTEEVDHVIRSRDSFFLPEKYGASITVAKDVGRDEGGGRKAEGGSTVLALVIGPSADPAAAARRSSLRIEAVLARDRRFEKVK